MATGFSTNTGLSALPEYDQARDPQVYAELVRIRNAFRVLQGAIDGISGFGGNIVSWPAPLVVDQPVVGLNGFGQVKTIVSVPTLGNVLTAQGIGVEPIWNPSGGGGVPYRFQDGDGTGLNLVLSNAVFSPVGAFTLTIPAVVNDRIECEFVGLGVGALGSQTYLDMGYFINGVDAGWRTEFATASNVSAQETTIVVKYTRTVVGGDISGGNVIVIPGYKAITSTITIANDTTYRPLFTLKNFGQ